MVLIVRSPPGRATVSVTRVPGGVPPTRRVSSFGLWTGAFWNAVTTSPAAKPDVAAGERGTTSAISAPRSGGRCSSRRASGVTGATATPR